MTTIICKTNNQMKADVKLNKLAKLQLHNVECEANYSTHSKALCKRHALVEISTNGVERVNNTRRSNKFILSTLLQ